MDCVSSEDIVRFLEISKETNSDTARYYLKLSEQDVEKAINLYYQDKLEISKNQATSQSQTISDSLQKENYLTILQYNIQGQLKDCLEERTNAVVDKIKKLLPDVIMLQEVVPSTFTYIKNSFQDYKIFSAFDQISPSCFTLLMTRLNTFLVQAHEILDLPDTKQERKLIIVTGTFQGKNVTVMTSHLESMMQNSPIRMKQLKMLWEKMSSQDSSHTVVFGGDTNLRPIEVVKTRGKNQELSDKIDDVWKKLGSPDDTRYTWDCSKNDNKTEDSLIRTRYDRLFIRHQDPNDATHFHPVSIELVGTDRLPCGMFPSDHWGLFVRFSLDPVIETSPPKEIISSKLANKQLTILIWNIDGLDEDFLKERTIAMVEEIHSLKPPPDVIMFQEVVFEIFIYILESFYPDYECLWPIGKVETALFSLLFTKKRTFKVLSRDVIDYHSPQRRCLLKLRGEFNRKKLTLLTSHFESTLSSSFTRQDQLIQAFRHMDQEASDVTVILGGDLNLRDFEVEKVRSECPLVESSIFDVWEKLGSPTDTQFTWDCTKNDNLFEDSSARFRFDRFYMRNPSNGKPHLIPVSMEFVGTKRLPCEMFISDHWGILLELEPPNTKTLVSSKFGLNKQEDLVGKKLLILQWNVQGSLQECLEERTNAIAAEIERVLPEVVLMQDVVKFNLDILKASCASYEIFSSSVIDSDKNTRSGAVMMVKKANFQIKTKQELKQSSSQIKNHPILVSGVVYKQKVTVITSQFETNAFESSKRIDQLVQVFEQMKKQSKMNAAVIFAADTNIRNDEMTEAIAKSPLSARCIDDVWEKLGSPEETEFSWDASRNDNRIKNSQERMRFSRVFMRKVSPMSKTHFHPKSMEFLGTERLPCGLFPSDHWGILTTFVFPENMPIK